MSTKPGTVQVRFRREELAGTGYQLASITPTTVGAAGVDVLVSDQEIIVSVGGAGRYELGSSEADGRVLAALLHAVAAGGYVEDVGWGVRFQATLADGSVMSGAQYDLFWLLLWRRRRRIRYRSYQPAAPHSARLTGRGA